METKFELNIPENDEKAAAEEVDAVAVDSAVDVVAEEVLVVTVVVEVDTAVIVVVDDRSAVVEVAEAVAVDTETVVAVAEIQIAAAIGTVAEALAAGTEVMKAAVAEVEEEEEVLRIEVVRQYLEVAAAGNLKNLTHISVFFFLTLLHFADFLNEHRRCDLDAPEGRPTGPPMGLACPRISLLIETCLFSLLLLRFLIAYLDTVAEVVTHRQATKAHTAEASLTAAAVPGSTSSSLT